MNPKFNPEMLILGRELRQLTQAELAKLSHVDQGLISKYEGYVREISQADLEKISNTLRLPPAFFFQQGDRHGLDGSMIFNRRRKQVPVSVFKSFQAQINILRFVIQYLINNVDLEIPNELPNLTLDTHSTEEIEQIAAMTRKAWNLPLGPIRSVIGVIETLGGIVKMQDLGTPQVDALVQVIPNTPPIFITNSGLSGERLRFTLAHEIGHLIMHKFNFSEELGEREADKYASAFLMPADEIANQLEPVELSHLIQLKQYWKVSIQALIHRAQDLEIITERKARSLYTELSKLGYRTREPYPIPREEPQLLRQLVNIHLKNLNYTYSELSELVRLYEAEMAKMLMDEDKTISDEFKFRIVKSNRN